ncbi:c-type cytochrome [Adhaeribacter terreus]|uniref:C-type cytochrome n=1 Tax=Adhaeribacter terreus TaxID=529703 RepID=A0ABW0E9J7_9BACT
MKKIFVPATCMLFSSVVFLNACNNAGKPVETNENQANVELADSGEKKLSTEELVTKGEHLVTVGVCDDCHSPKKYKNGIPEPDQAKRLSGHPAGLKLAPYDAKTVKNGWVLGNEHFTAWVGPWGTSFSANLTPDTATGIGNWTEEQFFISIREGKFHGLEDGRMLLPPMPWPNFKNYTDEELKAIFAYLKSIPAVKNAVPAPIPPKGA